MEGKTNPSRRNHRYRAIRTDLSIQHIKDEFAVECYEEMIRFHIMAEHELCEETATVTNPHGFNSHLNVEQMYKVRAPPPSTHPLNQPQPPPSPPPSPSSLLAP